MSPELSKQLAELAQKMGVSASELWPILVMRARLDAIISASFDVLIFVAVAISAPMLITQIKVNKGRFGDSFWLDLSIPIILVIMAIFCLLAGIDVLQSIPKIVYPQSEALRNILGR